MKSPNAHNVARRFSFERLCTGFTDSGEYDHLCIIMSKNENRMLGQKYLMVSRTSFGVVKLLDVRNYENHICMALQDFSTGTIKNVHLDIDNPTFSFLLISWQDIRGMGMTCHGDKLNHDDLLDFDF